MYELVSRGQTAYFSFDRLQRCSARMTYKVVLKFVATYHSSVFEWCQHQLVANQQSPKSGDSLDKTCNGSTPDPYFSPPPYQKKNKRSGHARLCMSIHLMRPQSEIFKLFSNKLYALTWALIHPQLDLKPTINFFTPVIG